MPTSMTTIMKRVEFILKTPILASVFVPASKIFQELGGYRKIGLKVEDLFLEETPIMQKAINRLPKDEYYARNFRLLTAHQCAITHHLLPANKQVKPEEDTLVLTPYILEAEREAFEKKELDDMIIVKK